MELPNPEKVVKCPRCGSSKLWKNGLRYFEEQDQMIQRWICRDCGYRFTERPLQKSHEWSINNPSALALKHQICALKDAKNLEPQTENKTVAGESPQATTTDSNVKGKLLKFSLWMQKEGLRETTIRGRIKLMQILCRRGAELYDPESIKKTIAKQPWCEGRKANAVDAYSSFLQMAGGTWTPPKYKSIPKHPFVPKETEIDQLIAACSDRMGTFLQLLKETGARPGEAWQLKWEDIDFETNTLRITPEKNSNPRIFHMSQKLTGMLRTLQKNYAERLFSTPNMLLDNYRNNYEQQRKRIAAKTQNQRLNKIQFKTFRTWKGTMEYHRTKDVLHVMQVLGHKNIKNTLIYIQLEEALFKDEIDYISKVAKTEADACVLIEAGFDYICDFDGHKLFRKKKY
jgi:integrase